MGRKPNLVKRVKVHISISKPCYDALRRMVETGAWGSTVTEALVRVLEPVVLEKAPRAEPET